MLPPLEASLLRRREKVETSRMFMWTGRGQVQAASVSHCAVIARSLTQGDSRPAALMSKLRRAPEASRNGLGEAKRKPFSEQAGVA